MADGGVVMLVAIDESSNERAGIDEDHEASP